MGLTLMEKDTPDGKRPDELSTSSPPSQTGNVTPIGKKPRKPPIRHRGKIQRTYTPRAPLGDPEIIWEPQSDVGRSRSEVVREGLVPRIRRRSCDGASIVDRLIGIGSGVPQHQVAVLQSRDPETGQVTPVVFNYVGVAPLELQVKALGMLLDRGWGRPVEYKDVTERRAFNMIFFGGDRDPVRSGELKPKPQPELPPHEGPGER